jgi:hypothetical protein
MTNPAVGRSAEFSAPCHFTEPGLAATDSEYPNFVWSIFGKKMECRVKPGK